MDEKYASTHSPLFVSEETTVCRLDWIIIHLLIRSNHKDVALWLCRLAESSAFWRWNHRKLLPKIAAHTRMLGYFPTKLTLYFEFNLDIYHHDQLRNTICNLLLTKSASKIVEMIDIKSQFDHGLRSPQTFFWSPQNWAEKKLHESWHIWTHLHSEVAHSTANWNLSFFENNKNI